MALVKPTIQEVGAQVHARTVRQAFSAFLAGSGVAEATDYQVSGDPTTLSVNISPGTAFLKMPGTLTGYEPLISDNAENRPVGSAPGSGVRTDLVYLGISDKEFGDSINDWDIFYKANTSIGTGKPPLADTMSATYTLAEVDVPAHATKGSQCTIRRKTATTAPVRDGGYGAGDVNLPPQWFYEHHKTGVGAGGLMIAGTACPFVPRAIFAQGTSPIYFDPHIIGSIVIDRTSFKQGSYKCQAFDVLGNEMPTGYTIEYDALFIP